MVRDEHLDEYLDGSSARPSSEWLRSEDEAGDGLSRAQAAGAIAAVAVAALLVLGPAAVAAAALFAPGLLDRVTPWLAGASLAFSIVAAGRVPAAAIFALVVVSNRAER